jgi:glycosyltransferase involved in cell wall biosynthesis
VIRHARKFLGEPVEMIALVDPQMPAVAEAYRSLFDGSKAFVSPPGENDGPAIFLQPSPMTHPATRIAPWLTRKHILTCEIFYDLIPLDEPPRYLNTEQLRLEYLANLTWIKRYHLHAPISKFAASCLIDTLGIASKDVLVTGAGIRQAFTDFDAARVADQPSVSRFQPGKYFIQLGGSDSRKNAEAVMKAHGKLTRQGRRIGLVIAGHYLEGYRSVLLAMHREYGGADADVQFTPDITDEELTILYHRALACICPSKSEGFSLPVVEAIACGCPVIAANCAAQLELVQQSEALFEPDDFDTLARRMDSFLEDASLREKLFRQQEPMGQRYHEVDVAARVWHTVRERWQRDFARPSSIRKSQRARIAVLMPYPETAATEGAVRSSASYFRSTLKELAHHADVEVFTPTRSPLKDPWIADFHPLSTLPYTLPQYDHVLALLGNDPQYRRIAAIQRRYGGPCITFDDRLIEFHRKVFGDDSAEEAASRVLGRNVEAEEFAEWIEDPRRMPMSFFEPLARTAHPLIVHSRQLQRKLARHGFHSVGHLPPAGLQRFSQEALSPESRSAAKAKLGFRPDRVHLLIPGGNIHEWGHWEIPYVLEQLRRWGIEGEAHWVSGIGPALPFEMEKVGGRLGNRDRLHFHDVPANQLIPEEFYLGADFAVVFRTHGLLGVPLDVLDCVDAQLPTVMSWELSQALALDGVVKEVREPVGAFLIAEAIQSAIRRGSHLERRTAQWQRFAQERSPRRYALNLLEALRTASRTLSAVA